MLKVKNIGKWRILVQHIKADISVYDFVGRFAILWMLPLLDVLHLLPENI